MTKKQLEKLKELYTRYNQCRDAELDRFWKNSVFVWVFLSLCFTAFGMLVKDFNMPTKSMDVDNISKVGYYVFLSIISIVGLIMSWIWVWMARGLKAWYEVYENAIWEIEPCRNEFCYPHKYTIDKFWTIKEPKTFVDAKPFSPSKIVILIGWLLVYTWSIALIYSSVQFMLSGTICCLIPCCNGCRYWVNWLIVIPSISFVFVLIWLLQKRIISSTLRDKEHNDVFKSIRHELMGNSKVSSLYLEVKNEDVSFFLHPKNVNEEYKILQAMFSNIKFRYDDLYIVKCSYNEMLKRYQIIDNFRKLLINDFELYHKKITINNNQILLSSSDNVILRRTKDQLIYKIQECKYLKDRECEFESDINAEIIIKENNIVVPYALIDKFEVGFMSKIKYYIKQCKKHLKICKR